jgi:GNAT superfamily N-acetyltransferase
MLSTNFPGNVNIRAAFPTDFPSMVRIWQEAFGGGGEAAAFLQEYYTPAGAVAAELNGAVIAAAYLVFGARVLDNAGDTRSCPYLYAVAVDKRFRGYGYGKAIVSFAVRQALQLGYNCIFTCPERPELFSYYRALGFTQEISVKKRLFLPAKWRESVWTLERGLLLG